MLYKNIGVLCVLFFIFFYGCINDDNEIINEPGPIPVILTDTLEVYNGALLENSLVLAILNGGNESYLLDKRGNKVHEWNFESRLGNDLEILPDGKLLGIFKVESPDFSFGGYGGIIKIINIDGSTHWEFNYASEDIMAHHDVEMLPNGNVLFMVWERIDAITAQQAGVNTAVDIFPEVLVEVNPNTNQVVWEWHSFNHMVQDMDDTLSNYGVVKNNPQLINFNYQEIDNGDLMHANGLDYDAVKDVIYMSVNFYSEVWVIDHSTTSAEAATDMGGNFDKGGNLLYRFGNPDAYNNGVGERLFYNNHFPNLLENNEPGAGNILIYVNKSDKIEQSTVYELKMPETFNLSADTNNEPEIVWSFTDADLYHPRISGAVRLQNGNTLICEGDYGFWEVTNSKDIVWKYNGFSNFWRCYGYRLDSPEIQSLGL